MFEAYRARKRFGWRGWEFAPAGACSCGCHEGDGVPCTGEVGSGCECRETICRCACGIPEQTYGGDIWLVEEGHPRKAMMLEQRFAIYDASIPPMDELLKEEEYKRLLAVPKKASRRKVPAAV